MIVGCSSAETERSSEGAVSTSSPPPYFVTRIQTGERCLIQAVDPVTQNRHRTAKMKRHLHSLLQRKRTEFEGTRDTRRSPRFNTPDEATINPLKDGYDWLAVIRVHRRQFERTENCLYRRCGQGDCYRYALMHLVDALFDDNGVISRIRSHRGPTTSRQVGAQSRTTQLFF
jgi:hypothetical protein